MHFIDLPTIEINMIQTPAMGLGTYSLSCSEIMKLVNELPVKSLLIDTASKYGNERAVGDAIRASWRKRENVQIIGKLSRCDYACSPAAEIVEQSLERLGMDSYDAYLIHSPNLHDYVSAWRELIELQERGLVQWIGVSNFNIEELETLYFETGRWPQINQIPLNPLCDRVWWNTLRFCREKQILVQASSPFAGKNSYGWENIATVSRGNWLQFLFKNNVVSLPRSVSLHHMIENLQAIISPRPSESS